MGNQRGSAALLALIMMMLLGSMGATLLMLSKTDVQIATNHRDGIAAQYLAEAGIRYAAHKLKTDHEFVSQTEIAKNITTSDFLGAIPTGGRYTVQTGPDPEHNNTKTRLIAATGIVNQAKRQVVAHITLAETTGEYHPQMIIWNY